jgi:pyruvate/2-oxoglutarate dehydrogenase complex dihydrolipoamide acyltransferase (E2) component
VGDTPDEPAPTVQSGVPEPAAVVAEPTLKAAQLLARHGLSAAQVPSSGPRLSVADVEAFLARRDGVATHEEPVSSRDGGRFPFAAGATEPLDPEARGMLRTVLWQRDEAVPGYIEIQYDAAPWQQAAAEYQKREGLLLNPLLALMAYRLVRFASANPRWNSTIVDDKRHVYRTVNLGFTIQSDRTLYLAVLSDAASLSCREFVERLGGLQRSAIAHALRVADLSGATMSFSSMARWNVTRHVPVLPPYTSLIVAHASTVNGVGILGATYDHRVLTGFDAVKAIEAVATPEEIE